MVKRVIAVILVGGLGLAAAPAGAQQVKALCDDGSRACLLKTVGVYLAGLARHDASAIPFAPTVRATEQANVVVTNAAKFRSEINGSTAITGARNLRLMADPATAQVAAFYLLDVAGEHGKPSYSVWRGQRFKIVHGYVTEVEVYNYIQPQPTASAPSSGQVGRRCRRNDSHRPLTSGWSQGPPRRFMSGLASRTMDIKRSGFQPSAKGPGEYFTGVVRIDAPFKGTGDARVTGATVTFEAGARTHWHTHPLGQTLLVTLGLGRVQREGGPMEVIRPGDIVWFEPGEKHWHGASPTAAMTHIAIAEALDGKNVDWMEPVTDAQYAA